MARSKSISARLSLWLFCLGLLVLALGGGSLYLEVRNISLAAFDHSLWSDVEIFTGILHIEDGDLEFEYAEGTSGPYTIPRSGHYYQITLDGELFESSASLAGESLTLSPEQLVDTDAERELQIYTTIGPAGELLRAMERSLIFDGHSIQLIVANDLTETTLMLNRLRTFLLLGSCLGILLMVLLVWQISRSTLRPLFEFSAEINHIGEKTLDQRLRPDTTYREFVPFVAAFNALLDRLQESLKAREELLSEVSHQLKTPVAVIRSHCDIYLQKERPISEYIEALEIIRTASDRMGLTLRRLLSIAQSEANQLDASDLPVIDLEACLDNARQTVEPLAERRQIEISSQLEPGLQLRGQHGQLVEAFSNLLENALKYNQPGGEVRIRAEQKGEWLQIRIEDSGCGIDPQEAEKIFQRFYRGRGAEMTEGSGLGLVLVKIIIEAHQGAIEVSSLPQGGSCFCVSLPRA